jgi:hypothetical protein
VGLSRAERKKAAARVARIFWLKQAAVAILGIILVMTWYYGDDLSFTVIAVISFFGVSLLNSGNIRRYLPGLNSDQIFSRIVFTFIYLSTAIALIAVAGYQR